MAQIKTHKNHVSDFQNRVGESIMGNPNETDHTILRLAANVRRASKASHLHSKDRQSAINRAYAQIDMVALAYANSQTEANR